MVFSLPRLQEPGEYTLEVSWTGRNEVAGTARSYHVR